MNINFSIISRIELIHYVFVMRKLKLRATIFSTNNEILSLTLEFLESMKCFEKTALLNSIYFRWIHDTILVSLKRLPANISLHEDVLKTSWRRLWSSSSEVVLKASLIRLHQDEYICLCHTSSRRLQGVLKMSSKRLAKMFSRHLQDVFKAHHQIKLFFLTRFQDVCET